MRIVMISDLETSGGAAIAASRLADALARTGTEVIRIVSLPDSGNHRWTTVVLPWHFQEKVLRRATRKFSNGLGMYVKTLLVSSVCQRINGLMKELRPDVINIHNLHAAGWGPELVSVCADHAPTVWTLHDMWSFTGGCVYSYDCRKFVSGCDAFCPTPTEYPTRNPKLIAEAWELRGRILAEHEELAAVCPSQWLAQESQRSFWCSHRVEVIPNGLPLDVYLPVDQGLARASLGIHSRGPVLLVVAQTLTVHRKGGDILLKALQRIPNRPITLVTMGNGPLPSAMDGVNLRPLGYVQDERTKVLAYNAADLLVHPAPVDNLPNSVIEAMACGTPCVGFAVGGVPDMVRPGQTGWLAEEISPLAFARALEVALGELNHGVDFRGSCRSLAEDEYGSDLQAQRYLQLFRSLHSKVVRGIQYPVSKELGLSQHRAL